jgi:hypothetical protein
MDVTLVVGRQRRHGVDYVDLWWKVHKAAVVGDGVPHHDLMLPPVEEEHASMAALDQIPAQPIVEP